MGIIYKITNLSNGKIYIGQTTTTLKNRWISHICEANRGKHNFPIYLAIRKYGHESFDISCIAIADSQSELNKIESELIERSNSQDPSIGYNVRNGGSNGRLSESTKIKMSKARSGENHFRYGKHLSDEHRKKISESWKTRVVSEETKYKLSVAGTGRKLSDETRRKIGDKRRGHIMPDHVKEVLRKSNIGNTNKRISVTCKSNGMYFESIERAAEFACVSKSSMSRHLKGNQVLKSGLIFGKV